MSGRRLAKPKAVKPKCVLCGKADKTVPLVQRPSVWLPISMAGGLVYFEEVWWCDRCSYDFLSDRGAKLLKKGGL